MRLARVQHLLIAGLITRSAFCSPPSRGAVSAANSDLDINNFIAPRWPLPDANNSGLSNDSLAVGPLLPHRFRVPTTHTVLYLGFGIIRHRIDWNELQTLLMIAKGAVQEGIDQHGIDTMYPRNPINGLQSFAQLGVGIELVIRNLNHDYSLFTWGQLYDVVEGLRLYLVEERRNYEVAFRFYEDLAEDFEESRIALGYGRIQRVGAADGVAEGITVECMLVGKGKKAQDGLHAGVKCVYVQIEEDPNVVSDEDKITAPNLEEPGFLVGPPEYFRAFNAAAFNVSVKNLPR